MINELRKVISFRLLIFLLTIAISIYIFEILFNYVRLFSDILLIFLFAWVLSFILEPVVRFLEKNFKLSRVISTALVFFALGILITVVVFLLVPGVISQFQILSKTIPGFIEKSHPMLQQVGSSMIKSVESASDYTYLIPPIAQFFFNLLIILILSFYLIIEKKNIYKEIINITPKKWHENIKFVQKVIDQTFASFLRIQLIWGAIGGISTWVVLSIFGISFATSTGILAGLLAAIPVIGPIIGIIPSVVVAFIEKPDSAIFIVVVLFITQQIIYNFLGTKIISKTFKINPVLVVISLLIGFKIAGGIGAVMAIPIVSILLVVGREFYNFYFKHQKSV